MLNPNRVLLATVLAVAPMVLTAQTHEQSHETATAASHQVPATAAPEAQPAGHVGQGEEGHAVPTAGGHEATPGHGEAPAGGHHGPAMKLFGREYGDLGAFLVQLLNFFVYGAGLFFMLKGALSVVFKSRKEELETLLSQAERDKAEGEAQLKDMEAKMAGLEGELAGILAKAETDSEAEKQRVLDAARTEATQILAQAQDEIGVQKRQAEQELRALVAELAVEGAAKRLETKLQGDASSKALDRAIQQIGGVQ